MFVDEVEIRVEAGDGGDGCTAFRREKYISMGGPYGGNGGHGSDIIFKVDEGLHTLLDLRYQKTIKASKGENGRGKNQHGKGAEALIVKVPQGTVVTDSEFWVNVLTKWAPAWEANNWKKKSGEIKNLELVKKAYMLYKIGNVKLRWTRGHVGTKMNEVADEWANKAREGATL